jgi:hypothetical protein
MNFASSWSVEVKLPMTSVEITQEHDTQSGHVAFSRRNRHLLTMWVLEFSYMMR